MISSLIIDDEAHCITALTHDLDMFCPNVTVVETCSSGKEGIAAIRKLKPDLVFLDIEMPLMNGFEMLELIGDNRSFQLIFTTAYDHFVLQALRVSAIDYLLKPIDHAELTQAVQRAEKELESQRENSRLSNLLANNHLNQDQQRIALPDRSGYEFVRPTDICYCRAEGAYTNVYLTDNRKILISKALGETEMMLPGGLFERIHHSSIVNISQIKQIKKTDGLSIVMSNGDSLSVSRSKKDQLMMRLGIR